MRRTGPTRPTHPTRPTSPTRKSRGYRTRPFAPVTPNPATAAHGTHAVTEATGLSQKNSLLLQTGAYRSNLPSYAAAPVKMEKLATPNAPRDRTPRTVLVAAAALATAAAVYGSLVPFQFQPLPWDQAIDAFQKVPWRVLGLQARQDLVANGLVFFPIGFFWMGALAGRSSGVTGLVAWFIVGGLGTALAIGIEFLQVFFPNRTLSWNDVTSEVIGNIFGATAWMTFGPQLIAWLADTRTARGKPLLIRLLAAYSVIWWLSSLLPFDLVVSVQEWQYKWAIGRNRLAVQLADVSIATALHCAVLAATALPVGVWLWMRQVRHSASSKVSLPISGLALMLAVSTELLQSLVYSRFATSIDAVATLIGIELGGLMAPKVVSFLCEQPNRYAYFWTSALVAYAAILVAACWYPFNFEFSADRVSQAFTALFRVPFSSHYRGSEYNALSNMVQRCTSFAVLGFLVTRFFTAQSVFSMSDSSARSIYIQLSAVLAFAVGLLIELGQAFLPDKIPDITDVVLGMLGSLVATLITLQLIDKRPVLVRTT